VWQPCRPFRDACDWRSPTCRPISPLVGEMPGKAEGGVTDGASPLSLFSTLGRASSSPRPVSGLAIDPSTGSGWEAGRVVRASLVNTWHEFRAPPVSSPRWGGPGSSLRALPAPIGQGSGIPGALPARPSPGPGSGAGLATRQAAPPSRDRPGHRRPPRHPGPEPGSRESDATNDTGSARERG
jgi:hypothetical protein